MPNVYVCTYCGASVTVDGSPSREGCPSNPGLYQTAHGWDKVGTVASQSIQTRTDHDFDLSQEPVDSTPVHRSEVIRVLTIAVIVFAGTDAFAKWASGEYVLTPMLLMAIKIPYMLVMGILGH